jgi:hypothetical protein
LSCFTDPFTNISDSGIASPVMENAFPPQAIYPMPSFSTGMRFSQLEQIGNPTISGASSPPYSLETVSGGTGASRVTSGSSTTTREVAATPGRLEHTRSRRNRALRGSSSVTREMKTLNRALFSSVRRE